MNKIKKFSYLYLGTGVLLGIYSILSQRTQTLNIYDTYYVITPNVFALFSIIIYTIIGLALFFIESYIKNWVKIIQYLMFNIPVLYFVFSDLISHNDPGYYIANPNTFTWEVVYIPVTLFFSFLISILILILTITFTIVKQIKRKAIQ